MNISILLDFYGELLTEKQQQALDYYYNDDLSLLEIAQDMNISRQGARDFIKKGEKQLSDMESALGLVKRFGMLKNQIDEVDKIIDTIRSLGNSSEVNDELDKLQDISERIKENL